jgi:LemA protein
MKNLNKWITPAIIVLVIVIIIAWAAGSYNSLVASQERVESQWAQVENVYQRRADLIPNLVSTVRGYADFERQTLTDVIEARAKATSVNINPQNLDAASMQQFQAAQGELSGALSRLMVVVERYPDLKANQNFLELQSQLEGTENRIAVERNRFNDTARQYNTMIRSFPRNLYASAFGFDRKPYFEAQTGASEVPVVEF